MIKGATKHYAWTKSDEIEKGRRQCASTKPKPKTNQKRPFNAHTALRAWTCGGVFDSRILVVAPTASRASELSNRPAYRFQPLAGSLLLQNASGLPCEAVYEHKEGHWVKVTFAGTLENNCVSTEDF